MKINIHHEGKEGWVHYDPLGEEVMVTHPNAEVRNTVNHYLTNAKTFTMPASEHRGSFMNIQAKPVDSTDFMNMALTEMYHTTGVHVNWGHEDNEEGKGSTHKVLQADTNSKADKPIVKSLLDDEDYTIIN